MITMKFSWEAFFAAVYTVAVLVSTGLTLSGIIVGLFFGKPLFLIAAGIWAHLLHKLVWID